MIIRMKFLLFSVLISFSTAALTDWMELYNYYQWRKYNAIGSIPEKSRFKKFL
jgi:hypothetical protein